MKKLYLITGPSSVGKSTVSKEIAKKCGRSALIDGDDVYNLIVGSYVSPWKEGNHLSLFWKISIDIIRNCLEADYDVIFNYIITPEDFAVLLEHFPEENVKLTVLMADEETVRARDKQRPAECQMGERAILLLNDLKKHYDGTHYTLDTTNMTIDQIVNKIIK